MTTIKQRLTVLEQAINTAPMLVIDVHERPTPEQQAEIENATRTGRRVLVFEDKYNTAWMPGRGRLPPWELEDPFPDFTMREAAALEKKGRV